MKPSSSNQNPVALGTVAVQLQQCGAQSSEPSEEEPSTSTSSFLSYVVGDAPASAAWVKSNSLGFSILESTFRGIGQVVFANNPWSGLIILIALAWHDATIAGFALLATVTATAFGFLVLEQAPHPKNRDGLFGYCALLVGAAIPTFAQATPWSWLVLPVMIFAVVSAILFTSISRLLEPYKVPAMTLPFNVACLIWFSATLYSNHFDTSIAVRLTPTSTTNPLPMINGGDLIKAFFSGISQVFLCPKWESGLLIFFGVGIHNIRLTLMGLYGSVVGSLAALAIGVDHDIVYAGLYGYNAYLGAQAVGGVFYNLNSQGFCFATLCAVICALSTPLFATSLSVMGTSPQTFPFCFGTALILLLGNTVPHLKKD